MAGSDVGSATSIENQDVGSIHMKLEVVTLPVSDVASREQEDHRVVPLELAQAPPSLGVVGQLVVREDPPGTMSARMMCSSRSFAATYLATGRGQAWV